MKSAVLGLLTSLLFIVSAGTTINAQQPGSQPTSEQTAPSGASNPTQSPLLAVQPMAPEEMARQIYGSAFRLSDLLSTINSDNWKLDDSARKDLNYNLDALRGQLKTLESWRYQFSYQPKNVTVGTQLANAIAALAPALNVVLNDLDKYQSATDAGFFKQAEDRLLGFESPLKQYLASLQPGLTSTGGAGPSSSIVPTPVSAAIPSPASEQAQAVPEKPGSAPAARSSLPAPPASSNNVSSGNVGPAAASAATIPPAATAAPEAPAQTQIQIHAAPQPQAQAQAQIQPQTLSNRIYSAAYRVNDLLSTISPASWNMDDASRKSFDDTLASLRSGLKSLEERRYKFSGQLANVAFGKDVASGIDALRPDLDIVVGDVTKYQSLAAAPLKQAEDQLLALEPDLGQYLASLESPAKPGAVSSAGTNAALGTAPGANAPLQTEQVTMTAAPPPATTLLVTGAITPEQMKDLAHEIYVATYRVKDLLSVVDPAGWSAGDKVRASFETQVEQLRGTLKALESYRSDLSQHTSSLPVTFAAYKGVTAVIDGVDRLADALQQYQSGDLATQFRQTTQWLTKSQGTLDGYFEQMLKRQWGSVQNYETDLASCQKTLNYAMYSRSEPAVPMRNIMPVLQGRRVRARKAALALGQPNPAGEPSGEKAASSASKTSASTAATTSTQSKNTGSSKGSVRSSSGSRRRRHSRHKVKDGQ